jgi:hypothetical protein
VSRGEAEGEVFGVDRVDAWLVQVCGCRRVPRHNRTQLVGGRLTRAAAPPLPISKQHLFSTVFFGGAPGRLW